MFFMFGKPEDTPKAFSERLDKAWATSTLTPEKTHGRNVWISNRLKEDGVIASPESVRKWFAGMTHPRGETMAAVARILGVSQQWLEEGIVDGAVRPGIDTSSADVDAEDLFDLNFDEIDEWDESDKAAKAREESENAVAAGLVCARLQFAGIDYRANGSRIMIRSGEKAREIAVVLVHQVADRGGVWLGRLPEIRSGFEPFTTAYDLLLFIMPRMGREPYIYPIIGRSAAKLGDAGSNIEIFTGEGHKIDLVTTSDKRVSVSPIGDLGSLRKLIS